MLFALLAVPGVDPLVAQLCGDPVQGPALPLSVEGEGYGGSGPQGLEKQLVGIGPQVISGVGGLVG